MYILSLISPHNGLRTVTPDLFVKPTLFYGFVIPSSILSHESKHDQ